MAKPFFSEHLQVLGDPGLGHREFSLDDLDELTRRSLAIDKGLEDVATDGITEDIE